MPLALARNRTPYEEHRSYVLGVLGRRCRWLDESDREAIFHDAYALTLEKQRDGGLVLEDMHPAQVRAYLTQTALNKALDEGKRAWRKRSVAIGEDDDFADEHERGAEDLLDASMDGARVREIVAELPERQQTIVKLRFYFDRTPAEIQTYLGITERAYRRDLERAMRHVSEGYELVRSGRFCETRRSLILAHVAGIAGPNRAMDARRHMQTCPGCRQWAAELRTAGQQVAAAVPLPLVLLPGPGGALRERLLDLFVHAKQHTLGAVAKADPGSVQYAAAARPGAAVAAVAGCIALGGGATYCAVSGLPAPLRSLVAAHHHDHHQRAKATLPHVHAKPASARVTVAPRAAPAPALRGTTGGSTATPSIVRKIVTKHEAAVNQQFGFEVGGSPSGSSAKSSRPAPPPPPPPASRPSNEFGP